MDERQLASCGTSGTHVPTVAAHGQRQELKWVLRSRRAEHGVRAVGEGRRASCIHECSSHIGAVLAWLAGIIEHERLIIIVLDKFARDVREHGVSYLLKRAAQRWQ
eukprot:5482956-Pyramimonas_sp.AAC.1